MGAAERLGPDKSERVDVQIDAYLDALERASGVDEQLSLIRRIGAAGVGASSASRALIGLYERIPWRELRVEIVRTLGLCGDERACEQLIRLASDGVDLSMAAEAVSALGETSGMLSGEFLESIAIRAEHPLRREAVIAMSKVSGHVSGDVIAAQIKGIDAIATPGLAQALVVALGRKGTRRHARLLDPFLDIDPRNAQPALLNAALLAAAQIGDRGTAMRLRQMETRFRFFADELRMVALTQLDLRLKISIEDALAAVLSAKDGLELRLALELLRSTDEREAFEAFRLFRQDGKVDAESEALVRVAVSGRDDWADDLSFLASASGLRPDTAAALACAHLKRHRKETEKWLKELPAASSLPLYGRMRDAVCIPPLLAAAGDEKLPVPLRIEAINGLARQVLMHGDAALLQEVGQGFSGLLRQSADPAVQARCIRAVGQIRYDAHSILLQLAASLKDRVLPPASVYFGLQNLKNEEAPRILLRRLKQLRSRTDGLGEMTQALAALSHHGVLPETAPLEELDWKPHPQWHLPLLRILSYNKIPELGGLIDESLADAVLQRRLLAIVAVKENPNPARLAVVTGLLAHSDPAVSGRALDTLCDAGGAAEHLAVVRWLSGLPDAALAARKVMRGLNPEKAGAYRAFLESWESTVRTHPSFQKDRALSLSAIQFRDHLELAARSGQKMESSGTERADPDAGLRLTLSHFQGYSDVVKSTLRNAELTFRHRELFDETVDKSTIVVEYVKSIDLLLQERLGSRLFMASGSPLLGRMQSRVVELQLADETASSSQWVERLELRAYFTPDEYPSHKQLLIAQALQSGRISRDQYRVIDGVRAWSMLLLLFGRDFTHRGRQVDRILPLKHADNARIATLAANMSRLQEMRNDAAHRGTLLAVPTVDEPRRLCFSILNALAEVLPG